MRADYINILSHKGLSVIWLSVSVFFGFNSSALAQVSVTDFFKNHNASSQNVISHEKFQMFLEKNLRISLDGVNRIDYKNIPSADVSMLKSYLSDMQKIDITQYNRKEQFAFWLNLYNAVALELVIDNYPITTIKNIDGVWKIKRVTIKKQNLHLDDIEHDILRLIFPNWRLHAALSVMAYSSGNLYVYHGADIDNELKKSVENLLRHRRGVQIEGDKIKLTKIFKWYQEDFGDTDEAILEKITPYLSRADKIRLKKIKKATISYMFDWRLNDFN